MDGRAVPDHGPASIIAPMGRSGPAFMIFPNFTVITRYNNAENYVIGIGHLSDRLKGGPPVRGGFPPDARGMTIADRRALQQRLTARGFDTEGADGVIGSADDRRDRRLPGERRAAGDRRAVAGAAGVAAVGRGLRPRAALRPIVRADARRSFGCFRLLAENDCSPGFKAV